MNQKQPQRIDLGLETMNNTGRKLELPADSYPWITGEREISLAEVALETGHEFYYASAIGLHNSVVKLAGDVPDEQSRSLEEGLFKAVPTILDSKGANKPANVEVLPSFVSNKIESGVRILKIGKRGKNAPRLYFTMSEVDDIPLIVKIGIVPHNKQIQLQGVFSGKRSTKKHDG